MKQTLLFFTLCMLILYAYPQDVKPFTVNSAGGSAAIAGNIYEWSFAEMMLVNTAVSSNLVVTSGILQPNDIHVGTEEPVAADVPIAVYPNPTSDMLNLATGFNEAGKLVYQLYDGTGKALLTLNKGTSPGNLITTLTLEGYPGGDYVLKVAFTSVTSQNYTGSFKIQKIR